MSTDTHRGAPTAGGRGALGLLALALVAAGYFAYIHQHAINVPLADDIYDVLDPLVRLHNAEDLPDALQILYAQHTDHRTIASRLVYGGLYLLSGEVDFRVLNLLANGALLVLLLLLYRMAPGAPQRLLLLLPAALALLQLRAYGITFWAMASFAYFSVFVYGFLTIFLLQGAGPLRLAGAMVAATLACFSLASGQMIWLVGLASLAQQAFLRRSVPRLYVLWWLLVGMGVLALWRWGLVGRIPLSQLLQLFVDAPGHYVMYTFTLLGSVFSETSVAVAGSAGGVMLVVLGAVSLWRWRRAEDLRLEYCGWFIVLSVVAMVLGRGFAEVDYGLSSRYSFPSVLMLATTWMLLAVRLRLQSKALLLVVVVLALLFWVDSFRTYSLALQPYMERRVNDFNKGRYRAWPTPLKESNQVVAEAIALGIYIPPERPLPPASVAFGQEPVRPAKP